MLMSVLWGRLHPVALLWKFWCFKTAFHDNLELFFLKDLSWTFKVYFMLSPLLHRVGAPAHWCKNISPDIYVSRALTLAALKTTSNLQYKPDFYTYFFNSKSKTLLFGGGVVLVLVLVFLLRIQNCSLGDTIFGNTIGYKHLKGKFRHFPRCSLRFSKRFYSTQDVAIHLCLPVLKNHFPESATWIFRHSAIFKQVGGYSMDTHNIPY